MSGQTLSSYQVHEGTEALAALRSAWESLETTGADHIFQTYAHADMWQRTVGAPSGAKPLIVTLSEDGRVVGIFPACAVRQSGVPILTWLGAPRVLDYGDVIFDREAARTAPDDFVGESLQLLAKRARGSVLYLTNVREDACAFPALASRLRELRVSAAPFVPISGTWEEYLSSGRRKVRQDLRRAQRRLSQQGAVEFALLGPGDPGVAPALSRLAAFQRARFGRALNRTTLFDDRYLDFRSAQGAQPSTRVVTLRLDGVDISVSLGAVFRDRFYHLVHGFDIDHAASSPGFLLNGFLVRSCFENGWDPCDMCWGDEPWKSRWSSHAVTLTTFVSDDLKGASLGAAVNLRHLVIDLLSGARKAGPEEPVRSDG